MLRILMLAWLVGAVAAAEPTITVREATLEAAAIALGERTSPPASASDIAEEMKKHPGITKRFIFLGPNLDRQPYVALISERLRVYRALGVALPIMLQAIPSEPGWDAAFSDAEIIVIWRLVLLVETHIPGGVTPSP